MSVFRYFAFFVLFVGVSLFSNESIKIGVLAKRGTDITLQKWSATAKFLESKIPNTKFEIVPLDFEELSKSVASNSIDFVVTNTTYYVELEYLYGVSRIATLENRSFQNDVLTQFGGVIFSNKKSSIVTLDDIQDKRFVAVNINSFGGWVMAQKELYEHGISEDDFSSFGFLNSHDNVVMAVKNGDADVGTVRTDTLERMASEGKINLEDFTILAPKKHEDFPFVVSTTLYPEWPFAKLSQTPKELADKVAVALLQMEPTAQAAIDANIAGWTIPLDYTKVHKLLEDLQIGPYAHRGEFTLAHFYAKYKFLVYVGILGFLIVMVVLVYISKLNNTLTIQKEEIEELNENLELKVLKRTNELEEKIKHEKYLKGLIKTIADINELLITSYSQQTIIDNSIKRLVKQPDYKFALITHLKNGNIEILGKSDDPYNLMQINTFKEEFVIKNAQKVIESNEYIIEQFIHNEINLHTIILPIHNRDVLSSNGSVVVVSKKIEGFGSEEIKILQNLVSDIALALDSINNRSAIKEMELEKVSNYEETILAFVNIIEQRDSYTAGHTIRVANYCKLIANAMGVERSEIEKLERAAILHDIGKVVTPDAVLLRPGKLSELEYELIKEHSEAGYRMLSKIDMYKNLIEIIRYHHTRYDGKGYPLTSGGESEDDEVPFLSYIMTVADAFDAMTTNRIYKPRKSVSEAIEEIKVNSGTQFHPKVAKVAIEVLAHIEIEETSQLPENELEQRRFAYFFLDHLTDVYNEDYFITIMNNISDEDRRCLYRIELANFSNFNRLNSWKRGSEVLKELSNELRKSYKESMIFRYHGDNFIILFGEHYMLDQKQLSEIGILKENQIKIRLTHYDLAQGIPKVFLEYVSLVDEEKRGEIY